ncbi:MAG: helix-turn-helix domain-containing protein, partial [Eubacteriales bacterium]
MGLLFPGAVIRRERLRRSWSQEGLCRGICVVSYLSKIEQGKTEASPEVLRLLFERLGVPWYDDQATLDAAEALAERCYEAVL